MNLNQLIARRAELLAELERIEEAIANFADASSVEIQTHRNLRNTSGITINPAEADGYMVVYADAELIIPANESSHGGYVSRAAWAQYKLQNPDHKDWIWEY